MSHFIDSILCGAVFLLGFILFLNPAKANVVATRWFATFISAFFLVSIQNDLLYRRIITEDGAVYQLLTISDFVIAPLFYFSVSYYTTPLRKWKKRDYAHFGFAAFILLLTLISFALGDVAEEDKLSAGTYSTTELVFNLIFLVQVMAYCLLSVKKIIWHQQNLVKHSSFEQGLNLNWLKYTSFGVLFMAMVWMADMLFNLSEQSPFLDAATCLVYLTGICGIAYCWLGQQEIFPYGKAEKQQIAEILAEVPEPSVGKKELVTSERLEELKAELLNLLQTQKPFLDAELNLVKLAAQLKLSPHVLSYVINTGFNENFYQLINRCRIEEAKAMLTDPKQDYLNLMGIGFEVGFNSKSVFNATFKKLTGQTPSAYKQLHGRKKES